MESESNVKGEMGPEPLLEPPDWDDRQSVESRYTEESKVGICFGFEITAFVKLWCKNEMTNAEGNAV